jgi:hypothetical protein
MATWDGSASSHHPGESRFGSPLVLSRVHWVQPELASLLAWTDDGVLRHVTGCGRTSRHRRFSAIDRRRSERPEACSDALARTKLANASTESDCDESVKCGFHGRPLLRVVATQHLPARGIMHKCIEADGLVLPASDAAVKTVHSRNKRSDLSQATCVNSFGRNFNDADLDGTLTCRTVDGELMAV